LSCAAWAYRNECNDMQTRLIHAMLPLRPSIRTKGWVMVDPGDEEPEHQRLKGEGYADKKSANLKDLTGIDLDTFAGEAPAPVDPIEDFSGDWSETDPSSILTVTSSKVTATNQKESETSYVGYDFGASHFGASWEHNFEYYCSAVNGVYHSAYLLTNAPGDFEDMYANNSQAIALYFPADNTKLRMMDCEDRSVDTSSGLSSSTQYYPTFKRTSETAVSCVIYTDSDRTSMADIIATAITNGRRYRHGQVATAYNGGGVSTGVYWVQNLDLQEAAGGTTVPIMAMHYARMRA